MLLHTDLLNAQPDKVSISEVGHACLLASWLALVTYVHINLDSDRH